MKFIKSHWRKVLSIILLSTLIVYVLSYGIMRVRDVKIYHKDTTNIKIYEVWHIETFEGGGKSRISYIKNIARNIEKTDPNILFMIKSIDPTSLTNRFSNATPDIISFGFGVGDIILPHLIQLGTTYNVRDELISSGSFDRKLYAIPYIMSGYALFRHSINGAKFHCGQNDFISPNNVYNNLKLEPTEYESQYDAYKDFVYNKDTVLLGTARDLFRINNLNNIGRTNVMIQPINTYTDLIQYIGITHHDEIVDRFLSNVFNTENQTSLVDYSLFPAIDIKLYHSGIYNDMENAIKESYVAKVFSKH